MTWLFNKSPTLYERLTQEKKRLEAEASRSDPGLTRNKLLEKIRQLDVAAQVNECLSSPGFRAPT